MLVTSPADIELSPWCSFEEKTTEGWRLKATDNDFFIGFSDLHDHACAPCEDSLWDIPEFARGAGNGECRMVLRKLYFSGVQQYYLPNQWKRLGGWAVWS